jgi:hypothetical protein
MVSALPPALAAAADLLKQGFLNGDRRIGNRFGPGPQRIGRPVGGRRAETEGRPAQPARGRDRGPVVRLRFHPWRAFRPGDGTGQAREHPAGPHRHVLRQHAAGRHRPGRRRTRELQHPGQPSRDRADAGQCRIRRCRWARRHGHPPRGRARAGLGRRHRRRQQQPARHPRRHQPGGCGGAGQHRERRQWRTPGAQLQPHRCCEHHLGRGSKAQTVSRVSPVPI